MHLLGKGHKVKRRRNRKKVAVNNMVNVESRLARKADSRVEG